MTYELVPTSPAVSRMSGSSSLDSFRDGWQVVVQLLLSWVLSPELALYCLQHSCVVAVKLFLYQRENFLSHIFFREPGGANACIPLQAVSSETSEMPLIGCLSLGRLLIL